MQFLSNPILAGWLILVTSGWRAPELRTISRSAGPSPAILPKHHADCSLIFGLCDNSSAVRNGTAP